MIGEDCISLEPRALFSHGPVAMGSCLDHSCCQTLNASIHILRLLYLQLQGTVGIALWQVRDNPRLQVKCFFDSRSPASGSQMVSRALVLP